MDVALLHRPKRWRNMEVALLHRPKRWRDMEEALKISGIGMFIVFFSLVIISTILSIMGHFFTKKNASKEMQKEMHGRASVQESPEEGIPPEIIAVITAAVSLSYGPCTRISSISTVHRESQYGMQGRINVMSSHKLK